MRGLDPSRGNPEVPKQEDPVIQKRAWGWTIGFGAAILGVIIWLITKAWVIIQRL